jgi:hypothetical protein
MNGQKPSEGRIVHYRNPGSDEGTPPLPAMITVTGRTYDTDGRAPDGKLLPVTLAVFAPAGLFFMHGVEYDETGKPGTWRWPPRV